MKCPKCRFEECRCTKIYVPKEPMKTKMQNLRVYLEYNPLENDITHIWLDDETEASQPGNTLIEHVISYKVPVEEPKYSVTPSELERLLDYEVSSEVKTRLIRVLFPNWTPDEPTPQPKPNYFPGD